MTEIGRRNQQTAIGQGKTVGRGREMPFRRRSVAAKSGLPRVAMRHGGGRRR
jgi:hypothetical protein